MSFEDRLEFERKKYQEAYEQPGYKMGRNRQQHAEAAIKAWQPGSYLDVGCGRGEMLDSAKTMGFDPVHGVEIVSQLINSRDDVKEGDGAHLPFSDREIDYVSMLDVVEHIPDRDIYNVFKELARVADKKILLCIANFKHVWKGHELHVNIKPYKVWDEILKREFPGWKIVWLPKKRNISETWELTRDNQS
jgi:ubiquinone/menaquinone biosynthesis C-methylase UbiE